MPLFPIEFSHNTFERQMFMTPEFVVDTVLQNKVKANWAFFASLGKGAPPMPTAELDAIFKSSYKNNLIFASFVAFLVQNSF